MDRRQQEEEQAPSFSESVKREARSHGFELDEAQFRVVDQFQRLYDELAESERVGYSLLSVFMPRRAIRGVYLWGGVGRGVRGKMKYTALLQQTQAIVHSGRDLDHFEMFLDQLDRGQELRALQAVAIKLFRRVVRCGHHDQAVFEQAGQEIAHQHRIADVGHVKFIQA
jgi:predicted ATPase